MPDEPAAVPVEYVRVVGAAIVDDLEHPSTLLAARRTEPPRLAGGWELPGGKVEPGEDAEAALHRELAEELGVRVRLGTEVRSPTGDGWLLPPSHRMRVWLVVVTDGEPEPLEDHDQLRAVSIGSWRDVAWLPADVPVVQAVARLAQRSVERPASFRTSGSSPSWSAHLPRGT